MQILTEEKPIRSSAYLDFLAAKKPSAAKVGFKYPASRLPSRLFDWQKACVLRSLELGRAALFEECGLGKTAQQLAWAGAVSDHEGAPTLILAPLAVADQTKLEGELFGVPVNICCENGDVKPGVNITNYERLDKFDAGQFAGVVLDESSILKSFSGTTKRALVSMFSDTPYRLACTATPSPNDHMELGNHAEFLGIMPSNEMLARWFINDTTNFGTYRLKGYAEADFWNWVTSWAMCLAKPSDLTLNDADDAGYVLPPLNEQVHLIDVDQTAMAGDRLFRVADMSATGMHREKRMTLDARVAQAAAIANGTDQPVIVWCETNAESEMLAAAIPDCVEVKGSDSAEVKESRLRAFSSGAARVIVTKPSIAGWGLNWQHCATVVFCSLTFSFEGYYQAVRRSYRFGQSKAVDVHLIAAQTEAGILDVLRAKRQLHEGMQSQMSDAVRRMHQTDALDRELRRDAGNATLTFPAWLAA